MTTTETTMVRTRGQNPQGKSYENMKIIANHISIPGIYIALYLYIYLVYMYRNLNILNIYIENSQKEGQR